MDIISREYNPEMDGLTKELEKQSTNMQLILCKIDQDIDHLNELKGELNEKVDRLQAAIDLNYTPIHWRKTINERIPKADQ